MKILKLMQQIPGISSTGGIIIPENEIKGEIELKNVSFNYPTKIDVQVTKNINLKVAHNEVVAFTGQSGSGKSSIVSLIERFYDPSEG